MGRKAKRPLYPDGTTKRTLNRPDGTMIEEVRLEDGSSSTRVSGRAEGTITERTELSDGSIETVQLEADGSSVVEIYDAETDTVTVIEDEVARDSPEVQSSRGRFRVVTGTALA